MKRLLLVTLVLVVGCVKRAPRVPTESTVTVGGKSVKHRAWGTVDDLCLINKTQFLDEQQAMGTLLADWLGQTSAPVDGAWDDEHLALLEEGARVLPTPLDQQKTAIEQAKVCRWEGLASVAELNAQAIRRTSEAADFIEQVKARLALQKWRDERPRLAQAGKDASCVVNKKAPPAPVLYFAAEDEHAAMEWLFCDGSKVVASPGNPPAWQPDPAAKKPKKEPDPKLWLDVASKYPSEKISRAPKFKKVKRKADDGAAEPEI